jgi:hypothetical protein
MGTMEPTLDLTFLYTLPITKITKNPLTLSNKVIYIGTGQNQYWCGYIVFDIFLSKGVCVCVYIYISMGIPIR